MKFKTRYPSIVPKGSTGKCIEILESKILALKIEFDNGEYFWFMKRDLMEVAE